jgi:hypothetical protein
VAATYTQESVVERRPDGSFANLVITYQSAQSSGRVIAETARNVLRIHTATGGKEAIREVPAPEHLIGLADSAFALYALVADLASEEGTRMTGVYPQSGRRLTFIARREGDAQEGTRIIMAGEITGTIWLDHSGHLTRIRFPESDLEIVRLRR